MAITSGSGTMRVAVLAALVISAAVLICGSPAVSQDAKTAPKDTEAAARTRTKLLKARVTVEFKNVPLRDALKELATQADMAAGRPVMWAYGSDIPAARPVTYACRDKPLDAVL